MLLVQKGIRGSRRGLGGSGQGVLGYGRGSSLSKMHNMFTIIQHILIFTHKKYSCVNVIRWLSHDKNLWHLRSY